jgi:cell division protein FtsB
MKSPTFGEHRQGAPAPVKKQKRNLLRRHWLSGALAFTILGLAAYTGGHVYRVESKLRQVRATRVEIQARVAEESRRKESLGSQLSKVASDAYMEKLAKEMGFVYPGDTVYQKGTGKGQ